MRNLIRSIEDPCPSFDHPSEKRSGERESLREWIITNGLGGYAAGTVCGVPTRRYHGLLIAALAAPHGRMMMLNQLHERLVFDDDQTVALTPEALADRPPRMAGGRVLEFRLEAGLPVWRYEAAGTVLEKRVLLSHRQNTVYVHYAVVKETAGRSIRLCLRPLVHFRSHDAPVSSVHPGPYQFTAWGGYYSISAEEGIPPLRLTLLGDEAAFTLDATRSAEILFQLEAQRGYEAIGEQWSPGFFQVDLSTESSVTLVASVEPWEAMLAMTFEEALKAERARRSRLLTASRRVPTSHGSVSQDLVGPAVRGLPQEATPARSGPKAELVLAADQFLITPAGRVVDAARAHAAGDEVRTVIAGYHWFTDWGRDTMISLEGLTLTTGRDEEAGYILRTFARYVRDGLIPNMFPDGKTDGLYHTADASLWFFHAIDRYLHYAYDRETLLLLLPKLREIVERHIEGTRFGIGIDPRDGLLRQGAEGYQLTWMDAKVGDWVVTPRRGKAVEINALWYNALRLLENWLRELNEESGAHRYAEEAERVKASFNKRFWYEEGRYLFDVVDGEDGDDPAFRPNQLFAFSLRHEVLDRSRWERVLEVVREKLVTPVGLRSLAPGHPDYKARYFGDLRARDAAYHQGTVWAWLIGPFIDCWLKVHPGDLSGARRFLDGFAHHLDEAALGTISEIFDAEPPFTPRGCVAQAWSVAEVLRAWVKTSPTSC
jgi:glycogen debranching enzyme